MSRKKNSMTLSKCIVVEEFIHYYSMFKNLKSVAKYSLHSKIGVEKISVILLKLQKFYFHFTLELFKQ